MSSGATIEVIAEPSRRRILDALADGEQPVQVLVKRLAMSQPAVSKQLRVLRDAGLVDFRAEGQRRVYRVCPEPLMELDQWLEPYRQMWRDSLDRLSEHLDHDARPDHHKEKTMNDDEATLLREGERPVLRFRRYLRQPIEAVWRAVTDPVEMRSWFPTRIEIDEWKVGATLTHHFDGHDLDPLPGVVLAWDPPRRVRFTWGEDTIGFDLTANPGGSTVFVLTEELSANHVARNAAGWEVCLDHLEHGTERQSWQERFEHYLTAFEPVLGPQEGRPSGHHDPATTT